MTDSRQPRVGILMGSASDWPVMKQAAQVLGEYAVPCEAHVVSAHRTPEAAAEYAATAHRRGLRVIIAGAGMAAHLAGVLAAHTTLPVIGVPLAAGALAGRDALLATVQMPPGVPVATVGIDGARNAALLAVQILATTDEHLHRSLASAKDRMKDTVERTDRELQAQIHPQA